MEAIKPLFAGRGKEYDQAFYKPDGQDLYEMRVHLNDIVHDKKRELQPLQLEKVDVCVAYNNKLTWLHTFDYILYSGIKFNFTNADLETCIPMFWARFDGQWEIVR